MNFKKMSFEDIDIVRPYFISYNQGLNYNTLGGFFAWRDWLNTEYAIQDNALYMKIVGKRNGSMHCMPMSSDIEASLKVLITYAQENNTKLRLCPVSKADLPVLDKFFEYNVKVGSGGDYIYDFETLKNMSGRKLHGQKNHLNFFKKEYSNVEIFDVDSNNVKELTSFILKVKDTDKEANAYMYGDELKYNEEVIDNFEKYQYSGIVAKLNGDIIGFILGEEIKETIFLHIMKIDKNYRGVAQFLITEYLKKAKGLVKYVNMEDDAGDESLRYTKMCYHPISIENPNIVEVFRVKE